MMISPEIIEDIKFRNNIETVISSYMTLKRAGSNYNGLCPFHSEKTPSFTVFPATQSFYCFGCGAGGDAITFIMRMENIDYVSAVRLLAQRSGVTIPESAQESKAEISRQRIISMNKEAARFFHACLLDENTGAEAREYLMEKRQLSTAIINRFGLGYAPNNRFALRDHLKKLGYTDEEMITGFLCGKSKNNTAYDYFRNRVIFPIIDVTGNVIAFGGRVLDDSKPKYLNSSDTPAFKKSKNLFALNYAKSNCADMLVLCEGYMDVIALHSAGFENAVATLGTAITPEQARIFSRYTKKVIISYDSDEAGQRAADKAFRLLSEVGVDVKILKMEGAKDPDEFIKKFGAPRFKSLLESSESRFDFEFNRVVKKYNINDLNDKIKASAELCKIIAAYPSDIERTLYAKKVSASFSLPYESIIADVNACIKKAYRQDRRNEKNEIFRKGSMLGDRVNPESASNVKGSKIEEAILGLMMIKPEHLKLCYERLKAEDFVTSLSARIFTKICEAYKETGKYDIGYIQGDFSVDEISRITKMQADRLRLTTNDTPVLLELIESLLEQKKESCDEDTFAGIIDAIKNKKKIK